jgi:hypothetical protein
MKKGSIWKADRYDSVFLQDMKKEQGKFSLVPFQQDLKKRGNTGYSSSKPENDPASVGVFD